MKNQFVKKLTLALALAVTIGSVAAPTAGAASKPAFSSKEATVKIGQTKNYKTVNSSAYSLYKTSSNDTAIATVKLNKKGKSVKITGVSTGKTVVTAKFKNYKTKKVVKAELPVTVKDNTLTKAAKDYFRNAASNVYKSQPADVFAAIDAGKDILIIDVRDYDDYKAGHLKGAVNIPYSEIGKSLESIPDDVQIYVNCYSGQTASQTVALLNVAGKKADNIQGGWNNGISQAEGYEKYVETTENTLSGKTYAVNADIKKAIVDYYEFASANDNLNIKADALYESVKAGDNKYTIVDIRSAEDYAAGHIEGANINVPFASAMPDGFESIPKDKPVLVYCYSGQTGSQTTAILRMLGYDAYNLSGGMTGWTTAEYPTVK